MYRIHTNQYNNYCLTIFYDVSLRYMLNIQHIIRTHKKVLVPYYTVILNLNVNQQISSPMPFKLIICEVKHIEVIC